MVQYSQVLIVKSPNIKQVLYFDGTKQLIYRRSKVGSSRSNTTFKNCYHLAKVTIKVSTPKPLLIESLVVNVYLKSGVTIWIDS